MHVAYFDVSIYIFALLYLRQSAVTPPKQFRYTHRQEIVIPRWKCQIEKDNGLPEKMNNLTFRLMWDMIELHIHMFGVVVVFSCLNIHKQFLLILRWGSVDLWHLMRDNKSIILVLIMVPPHTQIHYTSPPNISKAGHLTEDDPLPFWVTPWQSGMTPLQSVECWRGVNQGCRHNGLCSCSPAPCSRLPMVVALTGWLNKMEGITPGWMSTIMAVFGHSTYVGQTYQMLWLLYFTRASFVQSQQF